MEQGLLTLGLRSRTSQQPKASTKPVPYLDGAHGGHPRRCELDPERQPVEGLADLGNRRCSFRVPQAEHRANGPGALDEQLHRN